MQYYVNSSKTLYDPDSVLFKYWRNAAQRTASAAMKIVTTEEGAGVQPNDVFQYDEAVGSYFAEAAIAFVDDNTALHDIWIQAADMGAKIFTNAEERGSGSSSKNLLQESKLFFTSSEYYASAAKYFTKFSAAAQPETSSSSAAATTIQANVTLWMQAGDEMKSAAESKVKEHECKRADSNFVLFIGWHLLRWKDQPRYWQTMLNVLLIGQIINCTSKNQAVWLKIKKSLSKYSF